MKETISQLPEGDRTKLLLPFLERSTTDADGLQHADDQHYAMLVCLSCPAAVCQFIRPSIFHTVQALLQASHYILSKMPWHLR